MVLVHGGSGQGLSYPPILRRPAANTQSTDPDSTCAPCSPFRPARSHASPSLTNVARSTAVIVCDEPTAELSEWLESCSRDGHVAVAVLTAAEGSPAAGRAHVLFVSASRVRLRQLVRNRRHVWALVARAVRRPISLVRVLAGGQPICRLKAAYLVERSGGEALLVGPDADRCAADWGTLLGRSVEPWSSAEEPDR